MADMWSRKVFVALLRRYGIRPYRFSGQRYTTVMARVSKRFVDETLWPEFQEISETLQSYLSDVTDRVVRQAVHQDSSEAEVVEKPKALPPGIGEASSADSTDLPTTTGQTAGEAGSERRNRNKRKKRKKRKRG